MAHDIDISTAAKNAALDAITALLNGGTIEIYDGAKPAGPGTAVGAQVLLATLDLDDPAFAAAAGGSATAGAIASGVAGATGTASWFRAKASGGTAHLDGTVGVGASFDLNLPTTSIVADATVSCSSCVLTHS